MPDGRPVVTPDDPYPPNSDFRIRDFRYAGHLQLVRYSARPKGSDINSDWQLVADYAVEIDIDYRGADGAAQQETWRIVAPEGLYNDLSSVPAFGRWIVSKVGAHLEASIIHDYLYMKWTDFRLDDHRFSDWVFADEVLRAGMKKLSDFSWFERLLVNFAVGSAAWLFFWHKKDKFLRKKDEKLSDLLVTWKEHLGYLPDHPIPDGEKAPPKGIAWSRSAYLAVAFLVFVAIVLLGVQGLFGLFGWDAWAAAIDGVVAFARWFFLLATAVIGAAVAVLLVVYVLVRGLIAFRRKR